MDEEDIEAVRRAKWGRTADGYQIIGWRVKDFADGWIYFMGADKWEEAHKERDETGALMQEIYVWMGEE